jgi:hypothetical protein
MDMWSFLIGFGACLIFLVVLSQTPVASWLHRRAGAAPQVRGPNEKARIGEQITAVLADSQGKKRTIAT